MDLPGFAPPPPSSISQTASIRDDLFDINASGGPPRDCVYQGVYLDEKRLAQHGHGSPKINLPCPRSVEDSYAVRCISALSPEMAACAAASRAIGTRYGEQLT